MRLLPYQGHAHPPRPMVTVSTRAGIYVSAYYDMCLMFQCFLLFPLYDVGPINSECGNGIIESGEECDCGSSNITECAMIDPCCTVNCTLAPGANCRYVYRQASRILTLNG